MTWWDGFINSIKSQSDCDITQSFQICCVFAWPDLSTGLMCKASFMDDSCYLDRIITWLWKKANYLFEVDVSVAAKSCFDMLCPLSLPLRVFLSAQSVDVMREQGGRLIRGVSQTAAGHPRLQAARRRGATCVIKTTHLITIFKKTTFPSYSARERHFKATVTHIPGANKYRDHVGLTQLRVPGFHQLEELAEGITFLKDRDAQ